ILSSLPVDLQRQEIEGCAKRVHEEIGEPMVTFSYPVGRQGLFTAETRACLKECGVRFAFSHYGGYNTHSDWDDLDIRRIAVETYMVRDYFRSIVCLPQVFARPDRPWPTAGAGVG